MSEAPLTLAELAARGRIDARDLDIVMIAYGELSWRAVEQYLAAQTGASRPRPSEAEVQAVAGEIVQRICGCQYHDEGRTELAAADAEHIALKVAGACVHCPQITYTKEILRGALELRAPGVAVRIDGDDLEAKSELPVNRQLTMSMFMKQTGLSYADLDQELDRLGRLQDEDLLRLGERKMLRRTVLRIF